MFRQLLALALLGSFGSLIADDWSDFRIPKHSLSTLWVSLEADIDHYANTDDVSGRRRSYGWYDAYLSYSYLYDSERFTLEAQSYLVGHAQSYGYNDRRREAASNYSSNSTSNLLSETVSASLNTAFYPTDLPLGIGTTFHGRIRPGQGWDHGESRSEYSDSVLTWASDWETTRHYYLVAGGIAPQWGRIRDVSTVYNVYVLEKRLKEAGTISQDLMPSTKRALADLLYRKSDYYAQHELAEKYYWRDVEALLMEDPAFQRNLDAYALYRIGETVAPVAFQRRKGLRLALFFEGRHSNTIGDLSKRERHTTRTATATTDTVAFEREKEIHHTDAMLMGPRLEWYLPLGWTWHFSADSEIEHFAHPANDGYYWETVLQSKYAIADKWYAEYEFDYTRFLDDPKDRNRQHGHSWDIEHHLRLNYFIEDKIMVGASISHYQDFAKAYYPKIPDSEYARFNVDVYASIGVTYAFRGSAWDTPSSNLRRTQDLWHIQQDFGSYY